MQPRPATGSGAHHDDTAAVGGVQQDVTAMQTRMRTVVTAALLKSNESRAAFLDWAAAVLCANDRKPPEDMRVPLKHSADGALINMSALLLQLCEPFLDPTSKADDGYARLDPQWFAREAVRA